MTCLMPSLDFCYRMGRDYMENGATEENCHFSLFTKPERTKEWERGRNEALDDAEERNANCTGGTA